MTIDLKKSELPLLHKAMARAAKHLVPLQATLEVSYACNLRCIHCYVDHRVHDGEMSLAEWKDVLDQLADAGTLYLLLTGGEPYSRSDFMELARYAKHKGFVLMLLTNGTLLDRTVAAEVAQLKPLFVGLSLYGATASTHEAITGVPGSFDATIRGINLLKERGVPVKLQSVLMKANVHEAGDMRFLAAELGVPFRLSYEVLPTKMGDPTPQRLRVDIEDLIKYVQPEWLEFSEEDGTQVTVCKAGRGICSISPTGDVFPCALMPLRVGNLREARFEELWKTQPSDALRNLRNIKDQELSRCRECNLARYCAKCMGRGLTETGQLTTPAPSACISAALKSQHIQGRR
jgi:radical SAM protein with 4Fe4S-binding SPASM domain